MLDNRNVGIFWDYENCCPSLKSQGYAIVDAIRRIAHVFGSATVFKAYLDMSAQSSKNAAIFRSELQSSGVSINDCPHNGKKDVVDKMILVDMLAFALDHKSPATVILIAGDRDYAYALSTLRLRRYSVILIVPSSPNAPKSLQSQASIVIDWNYAILGKCREADSPPLRQLYGDLDDNTVQRLAQEIQNSNEDPAVTLMPPSHHITAVPTNTCGDGVAEPLESLAFQQDTHSSDVVQPAPSCALGTTLSMPPETLSAQAVPDIDQDLGSPLVDNALPDRSAANECVSTDNEIHDVHHDLSAGCGLTDAIPGNGGNITESDSSPIVDYPASPSPSATYNFDSRTVPLLSPSHTSTISGGTPISYDDSHPRSASAAIPSSPALTDGPCDTAPVSNPSNTDSGSPITDDAVCPSEHPAAVVVLALDDESPPFAEVDNPLDTSATNAVEQLCFSASQLSFDSSVNSPPANDACPFVGPCEISTSQMLSLSPFIQDPSVTVPNVEMGSLQANCGITDNSNNHPSDYQARRNKFVEDKIRCLTPLQFMPLVNQLLLARSQGINQPLRTKIAVALLQHDKDIYKRAGVNKFSEYTALAEQASLIELGGQKAQAWIGLHPKWFKEEIVPQPRSSSSKNIIKPRFNASLTSFDNFTKSPFVNDSSVTVHDVETRSLQGQSVITGNSTSHQQALPIESAEDKIRRLTPTRFLPLIHQLLVARSQGINNPLRTRIAVALLHHDKDIYIRAGAEKFSDYVALAEQASLIELGGQKGQAWVGLHPRWFKEENTPQPRSSSSTNVVEPRFTVSRASFDSFMKYPPVSDSSVDVPNVEMGSPQAKSAISGNGNGHSSERQALSIDSVGDKIRRLTPTIFWPLIHQLLLARSQGVNQPLRTKIAVALLQHDKDIYKRVGATKFSDYAALAEQASLIELGGQTGQTWIGLHPRWFKEETMPHSRTTSSSTNVVEPRFNVSRTSFDGFMSSPPANDPNITVPNVETGSTQAKSVISDNSNDHSSEYQALPIESIEDKIRRLTPPQFLPLINQLLLERSRGVHKASKSAIVVELLQQDMDTCKHAGVNKFSDYTALAEQASLIELGGQESEAWIGLHPKWFKEETMSPTPLPASSSSSSAPQDNNVKSLASFATTTPPPSFTPQATTRNPSTPPPADVSDRLATITVLSALPPADVSDRPIPFYFLPLVKCLVRLQKDTMTKPLRSAIGNALEPAIYAAAGVTSLKEYLALAVDNGIVEVGGAGGYAWVTLHPDVLSGQRSF